jgi:hypothetical protein
MAKGPEGEPTHELCLRFVNTSGLICACSFVAVSRTARTVARLTLFDTFELDDEVYRFLASFA